MTLIVVAAVLAAVAGVLGLAVYGLGKLFTWMFNPWGKH